ncbi:MAG: hypothetical protein ACI9SG_002559 [Maribacter sp.]|jgi:hypothetical protein
MSQTNVTIVELKALNFWLAKSKKTEVNPNTVPKSQSYISAQKRQVF